jgi:hypothetical protein
MKTNDITWKNVILQKIRKKNQWIWSYYDRETLVSNFKYRLKRKNDGEKSASGPPFSRSWADQLGCAVGPASWVARASFGISGWYLEFVNELEGHQ